MRHIAHSADRVETLLPGVGRSCSVDHIPVVLHTAVAVGDSLGCNFGRSPDYSLVVVAVDIGYWDHRIDGRAEGDTDCTGCMGRTCLTVDVDSI